jgi:CRISPR-associated protein Cas5d
MNKKRNSVEFKVHGRYALFSDPITRVGGEKFSYQVPTYQALKGILESVYWKPTFIWYIDAVRIMNKIQTESKGVKPIKMQGGNDLSYYTYLKDVEYQVLAHFEWNEFRENLEADQDENKHHNIAKRSIKKGGRRDIFLGTRECQGYVEHCDFEEGKSFYDDYGDLDFGVMFHGFDYPDETGKNELSARLWKAKMSNGIIKFPEPSKCELKRFIKEMQAKKFIDKKNFSCIDADILLADLLED